jgi:hypothetical protein
MTPAPQAKPARYPASTERVGQPGGCLPWRASGVATACQWTHGPRALLVDRIDTYVNTLLWCSEEGVAAMRRLNAPETA